MIKLIKPINDTTIYEYDKFTNTGIDEILELTYNKTYNLPSRFLIKFDTTDFSGSYNKYVLQIENCKASEILTDYTIDFIAINKDWNNGYGRVNILPKETDNVSWTYCKTNETWLSGSSGSYLYHVNSGGGTWNDNYKVSQTYTYGSNNNIDIDITDIVNVWNSGSIPNYGLIAKLQNEEVDFGSLMFYSTDTHTVFQPKMLLYKNDTVFAPNQIEPLFNDNDIIIYSNTLNPYYSEGNLAKIYFIGRERYPVKSFNVISDYLNKKYLPQSSCYSIIDIQTNTNIIPFDDIYTALSCDDNGNYIWLDLSNYNVQRYYKILIKVLWYNGVEQIYDNNFIFKVI